MTIATDWRSTPRYDTRDGTALATRPFAEGHIIYAKAIGAAMAGNVEAATAAANRLGELADAASEPRMRFWGRVHLPS